MASFDEMLDKVLRREGGYVNHPADRGGPTKYGITQKTLSRFLGRAVREDEVRGLSVDLAKDIYERNYFLAPGIDRLPTEIQGFIFDCAVNHGPRRALKFVQSVCNQAGYSSYLDEDGAMGPQTRSAAVWAQQEMGEVFIKALIEERRNFYRLIVDNDASQEVFLKGWMNRVDEFEQELA